MGTVHGVRPVRFRLPAWLLLASGALIGGRWATVTGGGSGGRLVWVGGGLRGVGDFDPASSLPPPIPLLPGCTEEATKPPISYPHCASRAGIALLVGWG